MREFVKHIHFVGIGGIGMSGIAEVLLDLHFTVSGSDMTNSPLLERLRNAGAKIYSGHAAAHVEGADAVVFSSAVAEDNAEIIAAKTARIPVVPRAQMLGELMRFKKGIAIAGTHGKTTTTSLVAAVLSAAGVDPTFVVGGVVNSARTNARLGGGEYIVVEADESDASFLHLQPQMAVVTNIDKDHMETYGDNFDRLQRAYLDFLHNLPFYGLAVLCFDDPRIRELAESLSKPFVSFGLGENCEYRAINITQRGRTSGFEVLRFGQPIGRFQLTLPGRHNVCNALAAIAIGYKLELPGEAIARALAEFQGIGRRFHQLGSIHMQGRRIDLVDDYAHHPVELAATLQATRACWPGRRIVVVFQPHRYSRTRDLFDDFAALLSQVDNLIVTEVYAAGEAVIPGSDGRSLCRAIRKRGNDPIFLESLESLDETLSNVLIEDDVLLTMGAGDIGRVAQGLAAGHGAEAVP